MVHCDWVKKKILLNHSTRVRLSDLLYYRPKPNELRFFQKSNEIFKITSKPSE